MGDKKKRKKPNNQTNKQLVRISYVDVSDSIYKTEFFRDTNHYTFLIFFQCKLFPVQNFYTFSVASTACCYRMKSRVFNRANIAN